jgi:hypothetical protein
MTGKPLDPNRFTALDLIKRLKCFDHIPIDSGIYSIYGGKALDRVPVRS